MAYQHRWTRQYAIGAHPNAADDDEDEGGDCGDEYVGGGVDDGDNDGDDTVDDYNDDDYDIDDDNSCDVMMTLLTVMAIVRAVVLKFPLPPHPITMIRLVAITCCPEPQTLRTSRMGLVSI